MGGKIAGLATIVVIALGFPLAAPASLSADDLQNERFKIEVRNEGSLAIQLQTGSTRIFEPQFLILFSETDPKLAFRPGDLGKVSYNVATWQTDRTSDRSGLKKVDTSTTAGDGFDPSVLQGDSQGRTPDYLGAAPITSIRANSTSVRGNEVQWNFPEHSGFQLKASVELAAGHSYPRLNVQFQTTKSGYYSIGYAGAPAFSPAEVEDAWQPLLWQGRRFPNTSYLTMAYRCPLPTTLATHEGLTVGVVADRSLLPFNPLPTSQNSRFGVLLRNAEGKAQPMLFAPVLGGINSQMEKAESFSFSAHLVLTAGNTVDAFQQIGREVYDFRDHRRNVDVSMNETLENMISYGMSEHSHFNEDLRGCSYATDVPGAVKNVSALHPLSAALVVDSPEIYKHRARPIMEYLLSREKFLFAVSPEIKIQSPSWKLRGPCAPISELAALYGMTGSQNPFFLQLAIDMLGRTRTLNLDVAKPGRSWDNLLAVHEASENPQWRHEAIEAAECYLSDISTPRNDLSTQPRFFWTSFVPDFQALLELYDKVKDPDYLDASYAAARKFAQFIWLCPQIPSEQIEVNPEGKAPHYWYLRSKGHAQMEAPSEQVPAWRLSEIGLTCESSGTSTGHRAILLATHAPWFLRLGHLKQDPFLRDLARSAIVGRYANFPGYHINTGRTTVYEKADYPLRPHQELSYNSFHYNHIWPHVALLIDYLVTEVEVLSEGQIRFPSRYTEGYAYLRNRVYGDRPGNFYSVPDAWLWMPNKLLTIDNPQLNYVSARTSDTLCIALTNQSQEIVSASVAINPELVQLAGTCRVQRWENNRLLEPVRLDGNAIQVEVPPRGIVCLQIEGVEVTPKFAMEEPEKQAVSPSSSFVQSDFAEGTQGYLISSGTGIKSAYVYTQATYETVSRATLNYFENGVHRQVTDASYPYEFTVVLNPTQRQFVFELETEALDGTLKRSQSLTLGLQTAAEAKLQ